MVEPGNMEINIQHLIDDAHYMANILRSGIVNKKPEIRLSGEVECDEVYVVAGHKGNPAAVKKGEIRQTQSTQRRKRPRDIGKRKATHIWNDTAFRRSIYSYA